MSSPSDRRTQAQVFHYWQLYKTSAQYLSMMEGQLVERQRQRRLQGALRAWRGADEEVLAAEAGLASPTAFRNSPARRPRIGERRRILSEASDSAPLPRAAGAHRQLATTLAYWKRFTRHHGWRRQRMQASLRFSMWLRMGACFKRLRLNAAGERHAHRLQQHVAHKLRARFLRATLCAWDRAADGNRRRRDFHRLVLRRMVNARRNRMLFAAFEGWSDVIANVQRLGYVIDTVRLTVLRKCLRAVWSVAAVGSRRRRLEAKALSRMHYARQRTALDAWRGMVAEEGAARQQQARSCLAAWSGLVRDSRTFKARLRSSVGRWRFLRLLSGFRRWRTFAARAVTLQVHTLAHTQKLDGKALRSCFRGWAEYIAQLVDRDTKLRWVIARLVRMRIAATFVAWRSVPPRQEIRQNLTSVADAMFNRRATAQLRCHFVAWALHASWAHTNEVMVLRSLHRICRNLLLRMFRAWAALAQRNRRVARVVGTRFLRRRVARAFAGWVSLHHQAMRKTRILVRVRIAMQGNALTKAWNSWTASVAEARRLRICVRRTILKMQNRHTARCLQQWLHYTADVRKRQAVILKMRNLQALRAFSRWKEVISYQKVFVASTMHAARRISDARGRKAFRGWVDHIKLKRRWTSTTVHAARRISDSRGRNAFKRWRSFLLAALETKRKIAQVVARMTAGNLSAAFCTWSDYLRAKRDQQQQLQRIVLRISKLNLARAWNSWADHVECMVASRAIMRRMGRLGVARAFSRWALFVDELVQQRSQLAVAMAKLLNVARAAAFRGWNEFVLLRREALDTVMNVRLKMMNRSLARAFLSWSGQVAEQAATAAAGQDQQRFAIRRMLSFFLSRAWNRWMEALYCANEQRSALLGALMKMRYRATARALNRWVVWLEAVHAQQRVLAAAIKRMTRYVVAGAFSRWREGIAAARALRASQRAVILRILRLRTAKALETWVVFTARGNFIHALTQKLRRAALRRTLAAFRSTVHRATSIQEGIRRLTVTWRKRLAVAAFGQWSEKARAASQHRTVLERIGTKRSLRLRYATLLKEWNRLTVATIRLSRLSQRALVNTCRRTLRACFSTWVLRRTQAIVEQDAVARRHMHTMRVIGWRDDFVLRTKVMKAMSEWRLHAVHGQADRKQMRMAQRILHRNRVMEAYKVWLWYVDTQWDRRRLAESNLQNMQLEQAIKTARKKSQTSSWGQSI